MSVLKCDLKGFEVRNHTFISSTFFFLCKIVLINEHCNVPVYSQGLLKCKQLVIQLYRVTGGILFWHGPWGEKMFYSLDDRLRLLNFFMQSRRAAEESKFQHAEIGLLTADD